MTDQITQLERQLAEARAEVERLIKAIDKLGLRTLVAGWNGENREYGPYEPHGRRLRVMLTTNCGTVYDIDTATEAARAAIQGEPA